MPTWLWIVIANAVVLILMALIGYSWRGQSKRIAKLECNEDSSIKKLLEHPILTIDTHQNICGKKTDEMKDFVNDKFTGLSEKMCEQEKRTGLLIENAILKSFENGKDSNSNRKSKPIRRKK